MCGIAARLGGKDPRLWPASWVVVSPLARTRDYLTLLAIAGIVIALDQWSKPLVRTMLQVGESWSPLPGAVPFLRVVHWNNTGAAFGLFPAGGMVFTIVAVIVSIAILYYYPRVSGRQIALRIALALQFGGAIGNLIDRLALGTVTDFIAVGRFPVFNVADASISIGVAVLVFAMWLDDRRRKPSHAIADREGQEEEVASEVER